MVQSCLFLYFFANCEKIALTIFLVLIKVVSNCRTHITAIISTVKCISCPFWTKNSQKWQKMPKTEIFYVNFDTAYNGILNVFYSLLAQYSTNKEDYLVCGLFHILSR